MRAIIIATDDAAADSVSRRRPGVMFPLLDRPFLQHVVEFLVGRGITRVDFVLSNMPEKVESHFGTGERWGVTIDYHLARRADRPYNILKAIVPAEDDGPGSDEPVLLVHGDRLPLDAEIGSHMGPGEDMPAAYVWRADDGGKLGDGKPGGSQRWSGWAWIVPDCLKDIPDDAGIEELEPLCIGRAQPRGRLVEVQEPLGARTYSELLDSHRRAFSQNAHGLLVSGREVEPGIWISRNVGLPGSVKLIPPVYLGVNTRIGPGARLGPNVVVGEGSVLDRRCIARDSLILPGSYVGESLELADLIVDRNHVVNTRLGVACPVSEDFIVGSMEARPVHDWLAGVFSRVAAGVLLVGGLPIIMLTAAYLKLLRPGHAFRGKKFVELPAPPERMAWSVRRRWSFSIGGGNSGHESRRAGKFDELLFDFLPSLINIAKGELHFVGVPPRTVWQLGQLPIDWRELVLRSKAGLVTEASVRFGRSPSDDEMYSAEAYYTARAGIRHDMKLLSGWLWKMIFGKEESEKDRPKESSDVFSTTLETDSDFQSLDRIRKFVQRVCREQARPPMDNGEIYKLTVAVQEAATNVMRHAYHGSPDGTIRFETDVEDGQLTIRIIHWGEGFDPESVQEPNLDKPREGGFGMYIISQYVDDVRYFNDDNGTHGVFLKKNLTGGLCCGSGNREN